MKENCFRAQWEPLSLVVNSAAQRNLSSCISSWWQHDFPWMSDAGTIGKGLWSTCVHANDDVFVVW